MQSAEPILDGDLLRAFSAFAETLSFTRAVRAVCISQPALFERVRRLSDVLGVPLYERSARSLVLTPQGVRVAALARETLARAGGFARELRGEAAREAVVLAAGEGSFLYLLGPAIERFVRAEDASLRLLTLGGPAACASVLNGESHLAVAVLDLVPRELVAREVLRAGLFAVFARAHPFASKRVVKLAELARERLVLPPPGRSHRDFVGRAIGGLGHDVSPPIEADGWPLMLRFASLGLGVAVVNGLCELPDGVCARPIPELGTVVYRLLHRRSAVLPASAQRLGEEILALARQGAEPVAPTPGSETSAAVVSRARATAGSKRRPRGA